MAGVFISAIWAAVLSCLVCSATYAQAVGLSLRALPAEQVVEHGGKAVIRLDLFNGGPVAVRRCHDNAGPEHAEFDFVIRIRDEHGHIPRLTRHGDEFFNFDRMDNVVFVDGVQCKRFERNEVQSETLSLDTLYVLEPNHVYTVSVTEKSQRILVKAPVVSNWVTVTVK